MTTTRALPTFFFAVFLGVGPALFSCASQDPGAFEIVPKKSGTAPTIPGTAPTVPPTGGDGGPPPPPGDSGTPGPSVVFAGPFVAGAGGVDKLQTVHMGNGGPTTIDAAKTSDCLSCHGAQGTSMNKFLAAGVAGQPNIDIGVKLSNGTVRTTRSGAAPDTIFAIDFVAGDALGPTPRASARNATKESLMTGPFTSGGCMQGACHGAAVPGVIFK